MFDPLVADIASGAGEKIATFVVKCLAVAGGFLVGYFLGGAGAWALDRWVFAQKAPAPVKKAVSWAAALALALIVALIVFGEGGNGLFGGGGAGDGKGTPTSDDNKGKTAPAPEPKDVPPPAKKDEPPKPAPAKPTPGDVRVTILTGDEVKEGRFYVIDDDPAPKTFDEFRDTIDARRKATKTELTIVFRFKKEPLSENHPAVRRVVGWVNEVKLLNRFE